MVKMLSPWLTLVASFLETPHLHVHENDDIYILNLQYTMFNVHNVTFRYIRIVPNFTIQQSIYLST